MKREMEAKYDAVAFEKKWQKFWDENKVYSYKKDMPRADNFTIDTPPPTVSGSLHVGHVFSYVQTDVQARFWRQMGKNVMYPMGFDDNGLPTERRAQNKYGITCDVKLPYDPSFVPVDAKDKELKPVSRRNFTEACAKMTVEDEQVFKELWKRVGLSVDWDICYQTISKDTIAVSQYSFLDLLKKGYIYSKEAPTIWDVTFKSAIAQAELEDREVDGAFHDIRFKVKEGGDFVLATTRPELLPAIIAIVAHPDDERYKHLFSKHAIAPLYDIEIPIVASEHAEKDKGTGIMMVCTFGDSADLTWWKSSGLPIRLMVGRDGRVIPLSMPTDKGKANYERVLGKTLKQAKKETVAMLREEGALVGEPRPLRHMVKFYEKGELPVEFVTSRQWYINILDHKQSFLEQGRQIKWHPEHMRLRYEHWVDGLNYDWCISRQRFFGVPFPVWYKLDSSANPDFDHPIFADPSQLPVDPMTDTAPGYTEDMRGKPNGFIGDSDVMDTWATSSLTPQIASGWLKDSANHDRVFPFDLRPQSHEIIRTWAFYTIVKSYFHSHEIPWKEIGISGWILDPDRKKMSKSKGNVVTPMHLLEKYSSDGVRYWASRARLGVDTAFEERIMEAGKKLAMKIFNVSKFVFMQVKNMDKLDVLAVTNPVDQAFLSSLNETIAFATKSFTAFDYAGALNVIETAFWRFCDNYVELVKSRSYSGDVSAANTLGIALENFLRLLSPFMPFVTEEAWTSCPWRSDDDVSVHISGWPKELPNMPSAELFDTAEMVLLEIRKKRGEAGKGMKWPLSAFKLSGVKDFALLKEDIAKAGTVLESAFDVSADGDFSLTVEFQPDFVPPEKK